MAKEIRLPDIGDFKDVPIIEILVAPGQTVAKDAPIMTLESDKATMDVPAPEDGAIGEIHVKVGDKVSQGDLLATYSGGAETKQAAAPQTPKAAAPAGAQGGGLEIQEPAPKAAAPAGPPPKPVADPGGQADFEADILVLGAGPGGYTAAFRAADLGQNVVLV
ncbi:MAG: dihydrolipoyl dehydrogenase, partial [Hyphomicrobiales bacterium]|nr:dihydrolipoyl dehydrogenase [Hyphomicrobiales bacterium]